MVVILMLSFLVLIHELGHFFAARKMGVDVEEFGIGYPPRLAKLFKWKETLFSFNWLPFGGFVKLAGDDGETFERTGESKEEKAAELAKHSRLFHQKTQLQRMFIVLAGASVNILFGILIFSASYTQIGIPTVLAHPKVDEISQGSPAEAAGFVVGDAIISIDGKEVRSSGELIAQIQLLKGKTVPINIERDSEKKRAQDLCAYRERNTRRQRFIGCSTHGYRVQALSAVGDANPRNNPRHQGCVGVCRARAEGAWWGSG